MSEKVIKRDIQDHMIVTHAGAHAIYAAAVYRVDILKDTVYRGKKVAEFRSTLEIGPSIHLHRVKDPERARYLHAMISSAAILNRAILELVELEEKEQFSPKSKKKKRRK
jgi:hypothetical protein